MCEKIDVYHMLHMAAPALTAFTTDTEMEPFVKAKKPFLGLIIPGNFRYLLPGNAVAIRKTDGKLVIGILSDKGTSFGLECNGQVSLVNEDEVANTFLIDTRQNPEEPFTEVKYLSLLNCGSSHEHIAKFNLFELTFSYLFWYVHQQNHPEAAANNVQASVDKLIKETQKPKSLTPLQLKEFIRVIDIILHTNTTDLPYHKKIIGSVYERNRPLIEERRNLLDLELNRRSKVQFDQHVTVLPPTKKPRARHFVNFTDKLINGFTEADLDDLLVHVRFKSPKGATLSFTAYLMHDLLDALEMAEYFDRGNRERDQKALQRFLGLEETRVSNGQSAKKSIRAKANSYLSELKKKRKNNG